MSELAGKVALVLGVGNAVGAGIAARLAGEGATVASADAAASAADVVAAAVVAHGRLDILVNALPAAADEGPLEGVDAEAFASAMAAGPGFALAAMQAALPHLKARRGVILNVLAAEADRAFPGRGLARAHGEAIKALSQAAAYEWGGHGVRVNVLVALADTPALAAWRATDAEAFDLGVRLQAIHRLGDPQTDIGGAALFLVSGDCGYVTGEIVRADGGQFLAPALLEPQLD